MSSDKPKISVDEFAAAFRDHAEELGIKALCVAFAESLASSRHAAETLRMRSSESGYLVTTLKSSTCTCGDLTYRAGVPERPHADACAWSRFMLLFGDEPTKTAFDATNVAFLRWAKAVDRKPDSEPYGNVVIAREYLERISKKKES